MKNSDRIHVSKNNTIQFRNIQNTSHTVKPRGLWYGFGASWINWVKFEAPKWVDSTQHAFVLTLDVSRICVINDVDTLETFNEIYATVDRELELTMIDWVAVQEDYDGIEINPYTRDFELARKYGWYSAWDVSSGCVWNSRALLDIKKIR